MTAEKQPSSMCDTSPAMIYLQLEEVEKMLADRIISPPVRLTQGLIMVRAMLKGLAFSMRNQEAASSAIQVVCKACKQPLPFHIEVEACTQCSQPVGGDKDEPA